MSNTGDPFKLAISSAKSFARKLHIVSPRTFLQHRGIFYIKNANVAREATQCSLYKRLEKQYRDILETPIAPAEQRRGDKIWVCWLQGFDSAPDVVRACLNSLRQNLTGYEIVELDESNLHDYVHLPDFIEGKYRRGTISKPHYSDLIRTELLCEYGGIWIDATVLCTSDALMPVVQASPLFVFKDYRITHRDPAPILASSWFISSVSNHPILLLTRKLMYAYWRREVNLKNYFLFHLFFTMAARRYPKEWDEAPPFNNIDPHMLQFNALMPYTPELWEQILRFSPFHKLSYRSNTSDDEGTMFMHAIREYLPD